MEDNRDIDSGLISICFYQNFAIFNFEKNTYCFKGIGLETNLMQ